MDAVLQRWPGYTLSSLLAEDAHLLHQTWALAVDDTVGEAEPDGESE